MTNRTNAKTTGLSGKRTFRRGDSPDVDLFLRCARFYLVSGLREDVPPEGVFLEWDGGGFRILYSANEGGRLRRNSIGYHPWYWREREFGTPEEILAWTVSTWNTFMQSMTMAGSREEAELMLESRGI